MIAMAWSSSVLDFLRELATFLIARAAATFRSSLVDGGGVVILQGLEGALRGVLREPWGDLGESYEKCSRAAQRAQKKHQANSMVPLIRADGV